MALDRPHDRLDTASPVSSGGRDSPVPKVWRGEDEDYSRDKGFRRYASNIDRALSVFDTQLEEWADYISFLGRLLKALQSHPSNISVVPSKSLVARRLAQCLAPTLPSGVHQKALEVYNYIFILITPPGVARDLSLYLPGLSPALSFASLTVRSPFLDLLRQHILPLPAATLRPACKALILTLLPGLEDEGSEDFEITYKLLNDFRNALRREEDAEDGYFWQCFFLATITSPSRRLGSLAYLVRELPKLGSGTASPNDVPEIQATFSAKMLTASEPGLLVRCFAAGLRDSQILIQRGFLDLLLTHLPLHAPVFTSITSTSDLESLMSAACSVVARRDMSLNRRLWAWLLGPEPLAPLGDDRPTSSGTDTDKGAAGTKTEYFETYGLKALTNSILALLNADPRTASERAKPFRICLSLMDRWEIGGLVVPLVFLPAMRSVTRYANSDGVSKADFAEVLRSANVFFNGVESSLIWSQINSLIFDALEGNTIEAERSEGEIARKIGMLELVRFIVANFNVQEEEMLEVHAPLTTLGILCSITAKLGEEWDDGFYLEPLPVDALAGELALELLVHIPSAIFSPSLPSSAQPAQASRLPDPGSFIHRLRTFYTHHHCFPSPSLPPPLPPSQLSPLLFHKAVKLFTQSLKASCSRDIAPDRYSHGVEGAVATYAKILLHILTLLPQAANDEVVNDDVKVLYEGLKNALEWGFSYGGAFATSEAILDIVLALCPHTLSFPQIHPLVPLFARHFWRELEPGVGRYHVEAVAGIWKLHHELGGEGGGQREVEACISALMLKARQGNEAFDAIGAFGVLWRHSLARANSDSAMFRQLVTRPLFLVIDLLAYPDTDGSETKWAEGTDAKRWIRDLGEESLAGVFGVLTGELEAFPRFEEGFIGDWLPDGKGASSRHDREVVDCEGVVYALESLGRVLGVATGEMWGVLRTSSFQCEDNSESGDKEKETFLTYFSKICVRGMGGLGIGRGDSTMHNSIPTLNRASVRLLGQLWSDAVTSAPRPELREIVDDAAKVLCWWLEKLQLSGSMNYFKDMALTTEILEVLGKTLRLWSSFPEAATGKSMAGDVDEELYERHVKYEIECLVGAGGRLTRPRELVDMLSRATYGAVGQLPRLGNMGDWTGLVREAVALDLFKLDNLIWLGKTVLWSVEHGMEVLRGDFEWREGEELWERDMEGVVGVESLCAMMDMLESLVVKAWEVVQAEEDILILEAKGRKSTTREDRGSEKGFLGGIFGSTTEGQAEEKPKDMPETPRQRVQVLITKAVEMCFQVWHWADTGKKGCDVDAKQSFNYVSLKLRSRARKLLELLFQREPGPCLESMVTQWTSDDGEIEKAALRLVNVLDCTQPHSALPMFFELVHERVSEREMVEMDWRKRKEHGWPSNTITTTGDLLAFLMEYTRSLENDAMVETWSDIAAFGRDVLANPMIYRGILPKLVGFLAIVGEKISKTSKGRSDRGMRREVADLWLRGLGAVFSTNPSAWQPETPTSTAGSTHPRHHPQDIVTVLAELVPSMPQILHDNALILQATNTISSSVIQPTIRGKAFPENVTPAFLSLFHGIGTLGASQQTSSSTSALIKVFKRDVAEAFNHSAFFSATSAEFEDGWAKILKIWAMKDRERVMGELLGRIERPTTAGIVFGVGATSARQEADARTKAALKRITALVLSDGKDAWVGALQGIYGKVVDLLGANTTSSPSSATRGECYVLLRALVVRVSAVHLSFLWPALNSELEACFSSCFPGGNSREAEREREVWDGAALVQGCKLLEGLLEVAPEEWLVGEWVFVTDGVDAIGGVRNDEAVAMMDRLSLELGADGEGEDGTVGEWNGALEFEVERMEREEVIGRLIPFFEGLARRQFDLVLGTNTRNENVEEEIWKAVVRDVFASPDAADGKV